LVHHPGRLFSVVISKVKRTFVGSGILIKSGITITMPPKITNEVAIMLI